MSSSNDDRFRCTFSVPVETSSSCPDDEVFPCWPDNSTSVVITPTVASFASPKTSIYHVETVGPVRNARSYRMTSSEPMNGNVSQSAAKFKTSTSCPGDNCVTSKRKSSQRSTGSISINPLFIQELNSKAEKPLEIQNPFMQEQAPTTFSTFLPTQNEFSNQTSCYGGGNSNEADSCLAKFEINSRTSADGGRISPISRGLLYYEETFGDKVGPERYRQVKNPSSRCKTLSDSAFKGSTCGQDEFDGLLLEQSKLKSPSRTNLLPLGEIEDDASEKLTTKWKILKKVKPQMTLFLILSSVVVLTCLVLYWNYLEHLARKGTKKQGLILDHWGRGLPTEEERRRIELDKISNGYGPARDSSTRLNFIDENGYTQSDKIKNDDVSTDAPEGFFRPNTPMN